MPTPSHTQIAPGTLCWLRTNIPANAGTIVEVVSSYGLGDEAAGPWKGEQLWWVKAKRELLLASAVNPFAPMITAPAGSELLVPQSMLAPIAGPGLVDHVERFDANSQLETIRQLLRDAGLPIHPQRKSVTER